ncbi:MAG: anion permease [Treponema sp.]|jgi:Na+/H+ antiporter NhaD/arsenite permease-like protein|nr:anion permease [Treponema sp.]
MKLIVLAITILMYAAVVVFPGKKAWSTLAAAVLILILRVVTPLYAAGTLVNWNVLMIYIGSLVLAELFIYSRVPARIADNIVLYSPNSGIAIVILLIITGLISAFVENVATVLVMAPIALALSAKLKMAPTRFMIGLAVMANLQGTATLVGDPPSMIFASYANYDFNDFFFYNGRLSIFFIVQLGMLAGALYFYAYFSRSNKIKIDVGREPIVSLVPSVLLVLMILGLAVSSFFHSGVSLVSGLLVLFLGVAGLLWYAFIRREGAAAMFKLVKGLDWETILFLIGIFVIIGAVSEIGLLDDLVRMLNRIIGGNVFLGFVVIILASVVISGFVDNVPYIIAMLPVSAALAASLGLKHELYMFALLIGSCLGGNLTPFGASANIVMVGLLKKEGITLNFSGWLKVGLPFTLVTTFAASLLLWFVWSW